MLGDHVLDVDQQDVGDFDLIGVTVAGAIGLVARLDVGGEGLLGSCKIALRAARAAELGSVADDPDGVFGDRAGLRVGDG